MLFAGSVLVLFVVAALAFDVGMVLVEKRTQQDAADAAALAGARYVLTDEARARSEALRIASVNGYDNATPGQAVQVYIPAIHGLYAGLPGFIEVDIQGNRQSIVAGVIGRNSWNVAASAVATNAQNLTFPFSMLALNPTKCKAIQVSGSGLVDAFANIQSNSNGSDCAPGAPVGFSRTGGSTINVHADDATCRVVGQLQDQGSGSMTCTVQQNSFALPDPLRNLPAPAQPALPTTAMVFIGGGTAQAIPAHCPGASPLPTATQTAACDVGGNGSRYAGLKWLLSPGFYPAGISVTNGATAYLLPGIYWIGGGGLNIQNGTVISVASQADATAGTFGGGVMLYNSKTGSVAGGSIGMNASTAVLKLKPYEAPTPSDPTAIYDNIVVFQDRTVTATLTLNGSASNTVVNGIIYVPAGLVRLNGDVGTLTVDQIIADSFLINGNTGTIQVLRGTGVDAHIVAAGLVQ